jgi:hypothetical protein
MLSVGSLLRVGFGNWQLAWDGVLGFGSQLEMPDGIRQSAGDAGRARSGSRKMDVPVSRGAQAPRSEPGDHAACRAEGAPPRSSQNPRPMTALSAVEPGGVQRTATQPSRLPTSTKTQPRRLPTSTKTQPRRPRTRTRSCTTDAHVSPTTRDAQTTRDAHADVHLHQRRARRTSDDGPARAPAPTTRTTRPILANPRFPPPHHPYPHIRRSSSHASRSRRTSYVVRETRQPGPTPQVGKSPSNPFVYTVSRAS